MFVNPNKVNYERDELKKVEDAIVAMNAKITADGAFKGITLSSFERYLKSYAAQTGDKGIKSLEHVFKYATMCVFMDIVQDYMLVNGLEIMDCLNEATRNQDNFYTRMYKDIVLFGKDLYESISGKTASKDFIKFDSKKMNVRAARISEFNNDNGVCEVYADPNGKYHRLEYPSKQTFFTNVGNDAVKSIKIMEQYNFDREAQIKGLYNIALKYRTLQEIQNDWIWPFKYLRKRYWKINDKLNEIKDAVRASNCDIFNEVTKDEFIAYMKGEQQVKPLWNLNTKFFADFNTAKINNVVFESVRNDLEASYDKNININPIHVEEVEKDLEVRQDHVRSNSVDYDLNRPHLESSVENEKDENLNKVNINVDEVGKRYVGFIDDTSSEEHGMEADSEQSIYVGNKKDSEDSSESEKSDESFTSHNTQDIERQLKAPRYRTDSEISDPFIHEETSKDNESSL